MRTAHVGSACQPGPRHERFSGAIGTSRVVSATQEAEAGRITRSDSAEPIATPSRACLLPGLLPSLYHEVSTSGTHLQAEAPGTNPPAFQMLVLHELDTPSRA